MSMLLILFMVFFGFVIIWAGPRLYRQLEGRRDARARLVPPGRADRISHITIVHGGCGRGTGNRGLSC